MPQRRPQVAVEEVRETGVAAAVVASEGYAGGRTKAIAATAREGAVASHHRKRRIAQMQTDRRKRRMNLHILSRQCLLWTFLCSRVEKRLPGEVL